VRTDLAMHSTFWVGVYPGLTEPMIEYVVDTFARFFAGVRSGTHRRGSVAARVDPTTWPARMRTNGVPEAIPAREALAQDAQ
jgi:hypothetical protein